MPPIESSLPLRRLVAVLAVALGAAAVVGVLGLTGSPAASPVGALLSGGMSVVGGAVLLARSCRRGRAERFRQLLASAAVVWGAGQVVLGMLLATGPQQFPTAGDMVSTFATPLVLAGLLLLPRATPEAFGRRRLAFEALMVGAACESALWLYWYRGSRGAAGSVLDADDWLALVVLTVELVALGLLLVCAVRDMEPGVVVACLGLSLYVTADVINSCLSSSLSGQMPWQVQAVACVAWPLILLGIAVMNAFPSPSASPEHLAARAEARRSIATFVTCTGPMVAVVAKVLDDGAIDRVTLLLIGGMVVGFSGRELVRARQSSLLLSRLARQAHHDPLTELGNRRAFTSRLVELQCSGEPGAVLTLDLDRFKEVNSHLGHIVGDAVLVAVSRAAEATCEPLPANAYRMGGDEFAVLSTGTLEDAVALAEALRKAVQAGVAQVAGLGQIGITASVGVARLTSPDGGSDTMAALTHAAEALRVAKAARDRVCVYTAELDREVRHRAAMERRLKRAVETGAIEMHFEPVVNLATGRVAGLEALSRWNDEELGPVQPDVFIGLAEQTGLIVELGRQALDQALRVGAAIDLTRTDVTVGVNVSPLQLRSPGFVDEVVQAITRYGVPTQRVIMEVTEGIFLDPHDTAVRVLHELSALGITIAIDDFGSGYSSLGYMGRVPADIIKVDRSLILKLDDVRTHAVIRAIIDMGAVLGLDVVVEGVESVEVVDKLRALGAGFAQGWLYSKAVPAREVPRMIARIAWDSAQRDVDQAVVARSG